MKIGKKKIVTMVLSLAMILGIIAFPSQTISADAEKSALAEEVDNTDALHLNKTAKWDEKEENVDITLEAFTTGELSTVEKSIPLDIVLVLDQSGSMADPFDYEDTEYYEKFGGTYSEAYRRPVYHKADDGTTHELNVTRSWNIYGFEYTFTCNICHKEILKHQCVLFGWTQSVKNENILGKKTDSKEISRVDALTNSVTNFVKNVRTDAEENKINHRIAIAGFASEKSNGYNTEILSIEGDNSEYGDNKNETVGIRYSALSNANYKNSLRNYNDKIIDNSIKAIATNGATRADLGMEMANNILKENPVTEEKRKQVVILFTDGEPNDQNGFDDWVADDAISYANDIKKNGAEVYTIGIFDGADANDINDKKNIYMNKVSSNFDQNGIDTNKREYYHSASNPDALNDVFDKIFENISKPGIDLDSQTIVQDQLSNYFNMSSLNKDDVEVYTQKCTEINGDKYVFSDEKEDLANPVIKIENKKVQVSGFDFNANFCAKSTDGSINGKKLVVKFKVKPIDGFIGGNAVPTNDPLLSGVYDKAGKEVKCFNKENNQPKVDVDINYHYEAKDVAMYLTENWENLTSLINKDAYWTTDKSKSHNISEQFVNDYVNIVYTFTLDNKEVGKYVIKNLATTGEWEYLEGYSTKDIRSNVENFNINLKVVPSITQGISNDGNDVLNSNIDQNKEVSLYIYKPIIKSHDKDYVFLGDTFTEELLNSLVNNVDWKCFDSRKPENIKPETEKPLLTYKYQYKGKDSIGYKPSKSGIYEVKYTVETSGIDITDWTKKEHDGDLAVDINPCNQNHFFIKVIGGTININKVIDDDSLSKYDFTNGDPIFGFKIDKLNNDDKVEKTYYRYVRFYKENGDIKHDNITPLTDLPKGKYRVTEMDSLRFDLKSVKLKNPAIVFNDKKATFVINENSQEATVELTNSLVKDDYFSDTDVVVNSFTTNKDGNVTWSQNWLNGNQEISSK